MAGRAGTALPSTATYMTQRSTDDTRASMDVIVNMNARLLQRDPGLLARLRAVAAGRARVHVTRSLPELAETCRTLAAAGTERVALAGGDGSLMAGVTALASVLGNDALPPIAPLPGGTVGTVARNWGIKGDPAVQLAALLAGPTRRLQSPTLRVCATGADGVNTTRIGFIFGTGLVARFFELYYEQGARGYGGAARIVSRVFGESFVGGPTALRVLTPLPCELSVEGRTLAERAWSLVCCSVVRNLGLHMMVSYRAGEDPRRPHLVATPLSARQLGPRLPLVLAGRPLGGAGHVDGLVDRFEVRFAHTGPYVLDGELIGCQKVTVSAGPELTVVTRR